MRLHELRASNFARLTAVTIRPDGAMVPITGANGQGKTSVLRAFWALMKGSAAAPAVAIHGTAEESILFGDLGEFKVTRTIKRDKHGTESWTLKVTDADGVRQTTSPQKLIDSWLGQLAFDPLAMARMDDKARFDLLRPLVKGFDFDAHAVLRKKLFDQRTGANSRANDAAAAAASVVLPPGREPAAIDTTAKVKELTDAQNHNASIERANTGRQQARDAIEAKRDEAEQLRARAASLEKSADELEDAFKVAAPPPAVIDTAPIIAELDSAAHVQATRSLFARRAEYEERAATAKKESASLTEQLDAMDATKAAAIEKAKIPVKGLALGDGVVTLNGLPFDQASTMEKIMASAAIGMAQNPTLRVMTIDEASELDSKALAALEKLAEKHDYQILYARVDETGKVGFVIEDGQVAS